MLRQQQLSVVLALLHCPDIGYFPGLWDVVRVCMGTVLLSFGVLGGAAELRDEQGVNGNKGS